MAGRTTTAPAAASAVPVPLSAAVHRLDAGAVDDDLVPAHRARRRRRASSARPRRRNARRAAPWPAARHCRHWRRGPPAPSTPRRRSWWPPPAGRSAGFAGAAGSARARPSGDGFGAGRAGAAFLRRRQRSGLGAADSTLGARIRFGAGSDFAAGSGAPVRARSTGARDRAPIGAGAVIAVSDFGGLGQRWPRDRPRGRRGREPLEDIGHGDHEHHGEGGQHEQRAQPAGRQHASRRRPAARPASSSR